jgi:hypothetical protein
MSDLLYCCGKREDICSKCSRNIEHKKDWRLLCVLNPNIKSKDICFDFKELK